MTNFEVGVIRGSSNQDLIGYKVTSRAASGGTREHASLLGGDWARECCERLAAAMTAEAAAVGTPDHGARARETSKLRREIDEQASANAERNKAWRAAKPVYLRRR